MKACFRQEKKQKETKRNAQAATIVSCVCCSSEGS
jgi:hypothetical protein